jgi:hypothetical protein
MIFPKIPTLVKLKRYQALGSVEELEARLALLDQYEKLGTIEDITHTFDQISKLIELSKQQDSQWQAELSRLKEAQKRSDETFRKLEESHARVRQRLEYRKQKKEELEEIQSKSFLKHIMDYL